MGENVILRMAPHVQIETDEGEVGAVLIDGRSGQIYACNDTGRVLATCLQEGASLDFLATALTSRFDVPRGQARQDAAAFAESLGAAELLTVGNAALDRVA